VGAACLQIHADFQENVKNVSKSKILSSKQRKEIIFSNNT
jgi:hypothetical protein